MRRLKSYVVVGCFAMMVEMVKGSLVYSSEQYAFSPRNVESHSEGVEYYVACTNGTSYTGREGSVPVFYCKYGNMIAVNVAGYEKPWLWKIGKQVVVLTGDESSSLHKAHSEVQIVVMDADAGVLSVAKPSAEDLRFFDELRYVEVVGGGKIVLRNAKGGSRELPLVVKHKNSLSERAWCQHLIAVASTHGKAADFGEEKWVDPKTGLEWNYVDVDGGVKIYNKKTFGCAVFPMPKGDLSFPEYIDGKPVVSVGSGVIVNCNLQSVRLPKTIKSFPDGVAHALFTYGLKSINVDSENPEFCSVNGALYNHDGTELLRVPCGVVEFNIPSNVVRIADDAFNKCERLTSVVVPASVREIGDRAFFMSSVVEVRFMGDAPLVNDRKGAGIYSMTPTALKTFASKNAKGWRSSNGTLPKYWCGHEIIFE